MGTAATGRAPAKTTKTEIAVERYTNGLWTFAYLLVTLAVIAIGNVPADRQLAFVDTLAGKAVKPVDLRIRPTGRGYSVFDGKHEMHLVPVGNAPASKTEKFIDALRGNIKAAAQNTG